MRHYIPDMTLTDYVSRQKGEKGLASTEDSIDPLIQWLEDYKQKLRERLITVTWNNTDKTRINRMQITRKQKWEEKQLYGHFERLVSDISRKKMWTWLKQENLKRETESLQISAQSSMIKNNHIKARVDKKQQNSRHWLCGDRDETLNHIISKCSKLAQKKYWTRYGWTGKVIHW